MAHAEKCALHNLDDHEKASPGDEVHIHFSGHGARRKTRSEDFGDHEKG